jgi:hypothetical protein
MSAKKVVGFLLCRSAFTQRNATSLVLVVLFFAVYVLAGGKVTTDLPKIYKTGAFGGKALPVDPSEENADLMPELTQDESQKALGIARSEDRKARETEINRRGRLFSPDEVKEAEEEPIEKEGLVEGADFTNRREQWRLERAEKKPSDSLSLIEDRLKINRRK